MASSDTHLDREHTRGWINALSVGARGDGIQDDGAFLQKMLDEAGPYGKALVPGSPFVFRTTRTLFPPVAPNGRFQLQIDGVISYEGSGHAIDANGAGAGQVGLVIRGGRIVGTAAGLSGIHLAAFNRGSVNGVQIDGFTSGDGILVEGANAITVLDPHLRGNKNGLHNVGVAGAFTGAANSVVVVGGQIFRNSQYGYWSDGSVGAAGANIANGFLGTVFEGNGTGGVGAHAFLDGGDSEFFQDCYLEFSAAPNFGSAGLILGGAANNAQQTRIQHNWFNSPGATSTISLVRSVNATISDNEETSNPANFLNTTANAVGTVLGPNRATAVGSFVTGPGAFLSRFMSTTGDLFLVGGLSPGNGSASAQPGRLFQGSGAPAAGIGNNGDAYFRTDTPAVANQRLYVKSAGAWVGIL